MKTILKAATFIFALSSTTAIAGGVVDPAMPEVVIVEDASNTSGHILVPIMFLIMVALGGK